MPAKRKKCPYDPAFTEPYHISRSKLAPGEASLQPKPLGLSAENLLMNMRKPNKFISKSSYLSLIKCLRLFWTTFNEPSQIPPLEAGVQHRFDEGKTVEKYAHQLFTKGNTIDHSASFAETIAQSQSALKSATINTPVYNALITAHGLIAEVDILLPGTNGYDLYEVKSATGVKDEYLPDIAFQKFVCRQAGLNICKCHLITINSDYVRHGEIDPGGLFTVQVMDDLIEPHFSEVADNLKNARANLGSAYPDVAIGPHCSSPYECPLMPVCWEGVLVNDGNIFTLTGLRSEKKWGLYNEGVLETVDVPANYKLNDKQVIQVQADRLKQPRVDHRSIHVFSKRMIFPLCFLDFETFAPAIPMFEGSSPYQQIPFQYSLHVQVASNQKPALMDHHSWIWGGEGDPRKELLDRLEGLLGQVGSIVVYNAVFERMVLKQAVKVYPAYEDWLVGVLDRFVDLLEPFKAFHYYHPDQHGSASIKSVLPALTDKSYEDMDISNGTMASTEYMRVMFGDGKDDRARVMSQLEEYCGLDTFGMVEILGRLRAISG